MTQSVESTATTVANRHPEAWWKTAVVYQVYIRSFADGNGDGIGDLTGLRSKLPYLADLGVDAVWINPWYPSPMADAGYDVADFRDIEPSYGTLAEGEAFIAEAHELGIRVILDIVPNHTSSEHRWFEAALRDEPGARERYIFRPGRGPAGDEPPNDWQSAFGGPAWSRLDTGEWYLHLFAPAQPDLNWEHPEVRAEFEDILRFWFDKGVDGFRIDVAHGLAKDPALPDAGERLPGSQHTDPHPAWDQDAVHEVYRGWRAVANAYDDRVFVAEAWVPGNDRLARYLRPDELHTAFQFDFLRAPWRSDSIRAVIDDALEQAATVGAPATWVLSNHDVPRTVTRYSRSQPDHLVETDWERARWALEEPNHDLGRRRARAAALLQLALPGTAYIYQGEELGLEEVEDLPDDVRQDPTWFQTGFTDCGRDGCRVPIPWSNDAVPYGFSPFDAEEDTWLPQPGHWAPHTAEAQAGHPESVLTLYRRALELRPDYFDTPHGVEWLDTPPGVLAFARGGVQCWVNTGTEPAALPGGSTVVLGSIAGITGGLLPSDAAVWLSEPGSGESR
ncbi:glycoside hydrolase family 13 protein [Rhodococcus pseudokoreensis]|uniref:Glycoside hydrolase family 13 protein n=1 Tax=Rhodococcus pseudokoreensis TaxID=2811421 RepID=A0A974W4C9_9NOCA|nr:glycoside hydrolase family 13 protein [Rhodococcus pseudokoreensis]QSE91065.1 glycoside hydrolase family 13 protein [Rhodococcus pseudokoreensis]